MTELIVNGDYVPAEDGSGLVMVEHMSQLIQEVLMHLKIKRTRFYPNKDYGTALSQGMVPTEKYALACARQALCQYDGVYVKNAVQNDNTITYYLMVNDEERQVSVEYENI